MKQNKSLTYKNAFVSYAVTGKGNTVVLLHGFGEDENIWNHLVGKLKTDFRVIVPDIPGSGKSTILKDGNNIVSIDDYAEVIIKILEKETVTNCTIIGHSMGGYITLAFAEKYPKLLNGFGLFHSSAFADTDERKQARLKSIKYLQKNDPVSFLKKSIPDLFTEQYKQKHRDVIEKLINGGKSFSSQALIQHQQAMINRPDRIKVLQNAEVPILFIIGEKDKAILLQISLAQCHLPVKSHIHILKNSAHMGMLEEKKISTDAIISFLCNIWTSINVKLLPN